MEITREIELPSNGAFYPIKKITLDAIGFDQEKKIFGSGTETALDDVINECVLSPKGFDVTGVSHRDREYILYQLRIHSYGPEYHVKVRDNGEVVEKEISLEDMEVITLPDDFELPKGKLPIKGDEFTITAPTVAQSRHCREYALEKAEKLNQSFDDVYYEQTKALMIGTVNGEPLDVNSRINWLKSLKGRDLAYVDHILDKLNYGYTGAVKVALDDGTETEAQVRITSEFFRPRFDD